LKNKSKKTKTKTKKTKNKKQKTKTKKYNVPTSQALYLLVTYVVGRRQ